MTLLAGVDVAQPFSAARLVQVFADCFAERWQTRLVGGADEPYYQPARAPGEYHTLYFRHDFFASALHEVAHWCIAGEQRRQQFDFGYWYAPDGRDARQQCAFEAAECRPQALEWFFSRACGYRFQLSVDNPGMTAQGLPGITSFHHQVVAQAHIWQARGLSERAGVFYSALCREFGTGVTPDKLNFTLEQLA